MFDPSRTASSTYIMKTTDMATADPSTANKTNGIAPNTLLPSLSEEAPSIVFGCRDNTQKQQISV